MSESRAISAWTVAGPLTALALPVDLVPVDDLVRRPVPFLQGDELVAGAGDDHDLVVSIRADVVEGVHPVVVVRAGVDHGAAVAVEADREDAVVRSVEGDGAVDVEVGRALHADDSSLAEAADGVGHPRFCQESPRDRVAALRARGWRAARR
jgi:hypothetical protein